jgi:hypothetical protein
LLLGDVEQLAEFDPRKGLSGIRIVFGFNGHSANR